MKLKVLTSWYLRNERIISSISLVGGFIFDIFALKRIDLFWENLWVGAHLGMASFGIVLINLLENRKQRISERMYGIIHFWLVMFIQFAFGGLLSTFLVFYFRSGTFSASWPFLLILAIVFVFNELLKFHYSRLVFQTSVLYISIYSFAIFIVPVIVHRIGPKVFILSGAISLFILLLFIFCLKYIARERFMESKKPLYLVIAGITLLINVLYFTNIIPPIPLSLKDAGVYHSIYRTANGYAATGEKRGLWDFFALYEPYHQIDNGEVYIYSSVFSPTNLNTQIVHEWQYYNEATKMWNTITKIKLPIVGGRDDGFRTFSNKSVAAPGLWRVDVKTMQGQLIGRIKFEIKNIDKFPNLITSMLN